MKKILLAAGFCSAVTLAGAQSQARYLLALSDTDMAATACIDGQLSVPIGQRDTLSIFDLSKRGSLAIGSIEASNSIFSPPTVMTTAAAGRVALVIETLKPRGNTMKTLAELETQPGNTLRAYDISSRSSPKLLNEVQVNTRPQSVAVRAAADLAVVAGLTPAMGLNFVPLTERGLGSVQTVALPLPARPDLGFEAVNVANWHPSGRFISVHLIPFPHHS